MDLRDLQTPALVLDRGIVARNAAAMRQRAAALGVRLRPHLKTAKSADVARLALGIVAGDAAGVAAGRAKHGAAGGTASRSAVGTASGSAVGAAGGAAVGAAGGAEEGTAGGSAVGAAGGVTGDTAGGTASDATGGAAGGIAGDAGGGTEKGTARGTAGGVTVSTLREAAYFLEHGFADITYAVGFTPHKLAPAAALMERGADLKILTDNVEAARAIAAHGAPFKVLIEIDVGDHRGGLVPDDAGVLEIARTLAAAPAARLDGVLTHAGQSYECRDADAMAAVAERERAGVVAAAERLAAAGMPCATVSVGSTPTATFARDLSGVTEMRPGVYIFQDLYQAGIGVCGLGDIAVSVLASVIGHRPAENLLLLDAGGLALSKDRSTEKLEDDCGYGLVCDMETGRPIGDLRVASVHQEHGIVTSEEPLPFAALPVGALVRVLPNHVCMTAAAYDAYEVIDGSTEVVARWGRCNGW